MNDEIVYKIFSTYSFIKYLLYRIGILGLIFYLFYVFEENPSVILFCIFFSALLLLIIGDDEFLIYKDRMVVRANSILSFYSKLDRKVYWFNEIERVQFEERPINGSVLENTVATILFFILPVTRSYYNSKNDKFFEIIYKNGKLAKVNTADFDENEIKDLINKINFFVKNG